MIGTLSLIMVMIKQVIAIAAAIALFSSFLPAEAQGVTAELGEPFELMFGQDASIESEDITVRFDSVVEDSRCPSDVVCIQQGQATIMISVEIEGTDAGQHMLTNGADESKSVATFGRQYSVRMTDLQPYPVSTIQTEEQDYVATLVVFKASANSTGVFVKAVGDVAAIAGWNLERERGTLVILDRGEGTRIVIRFTPSAVECIGSAEARECIDGQVTDVMGSSRINQGDNIHLEADGDKLFLAAGSTEYTLDIRRIWTRM